MWSSIAVFALVSVTLAKNIPNEEFQDYLVGGTAANQTEFPHSISLRYRGSHMCGGSLISQTRVLTAAHCLADFVPGAGRQVSDLTVVTGSDVLTPGEGTTYQVVAVHPHENYSSRANEFDVGVVELDKPVEFSDKVQLISLPEGPEVPDGAKLLASGFGIYRSQSPIMDIIFGPAPLSPYLRKLEVTEISNEECQKSWDEKRPTYGVKISGDHLCSSTENKKGYCNGDSGSGVLYDNKVVGLVSFGDSTCANGLPNVATRVGYYLDFINQHLK